MTRFLCVFLGALTAVVAFFTLSTFPNAEGLEHPLPKGFQTPVLLLEFATQAKDLECFTGDSQQAISFRDAADRGHQTWDMFFPVVYGLFMFMMIFSFTGDNKRAWLGLLFPLLAIIADIHENMVILELTELLRLGQSIEHILPRLNIATWIKWGAIGSSAAILGVLFLKSRAITLTMRIVTACVCFSAPLMLLCAAMVRESGFLYELASKAVAAFMFIMLVHAILALRKDKRTNAIKL